MPAARWEDTPPIRRRLPAALPKAQHDSGDRHYEARQTGRAFVQIYGHQRADKRVISGSKLQGCAASDEATTGMTSTTTEMATVGSGSAAGGSRDVLLVVGVSILGSWLTDVFHFAGPRFDEPAEIAFGDAVPDDFGRREGARRIVIVAAPGRKVIDTVAEGDTQVVVAIDDPIDCVRFDRTRFNLTFFQALREQTRRAAPFALFRDKPYALLVRRGTGDNAQRIIEAAIRHAGFALQPEALALVKETYGGPAAENLTLEEALARIVGLYMPLEQVGQAVTREEAAIVRETLSPLVSRALSEDAEPIIWRRHVLILAETHVETLPLVIDVTGGARILSCGPYLNLPPGRFRVRIIIGFSPHLRGMAFKINVVCGARFVRRLLISPREGGVFECAFDLDHSEPEVPIEIQFLNEEGVIEGNVALSLIDFTEIGPRS